MAVLAVNQDNFKQEVLNSDRPVVADFWATWCGPCRMLSPLVEEMSEAHPEIKFVKVNVDENMELAMAYRISAIPALKLFKDGEAVKESVGYHDREGLELFIQ